MNRIEMSRIDPLKLLLGDPGSGMLSIFGPSTRMLRVSLLVENYNLRLQTLRLFFAAITTVAATATTAAAFLSLR